MGVAFDFESVQFATEVGPRRALVIAPNAPVIVGHRRLEELREHGLRSGIDESVVDAVRSHDQRHDVVIFRAKSDVHGACWKLDPSLEPADADDLARRLILSHLPTYRVLMSMGVVLMVHADFEVADADRFRAQTKWLHERMLGLEVHDPVQTADLWILRNLSFYFTLDGERVLESVLPEKLPLIAKRDDHVGALISALPAGLVSAY